jgi:hypothetical protein
MRAWRSNSTAILFSITTMPSAIVVVTLSYTSWEKHFSKLQMENCSLLIRAMSAFLLFRVRVLAHVLPPLAAALARQCRYQ